MGTSPADTASSSRRALSAGRSPEVGQWAAEEAGERQVEVLRNAHAQALRELQARWVSENSEGCPCAGGEGAAGQVNVSRCLRSALTQALQGQQARRTSGVQHLRRWVQLFDGMPQANCAQEQCGCLNLVLERTGMQKSCHFCLLLSCIHMCFRSLLKA